MAPDAARRPEGRLRPAGRSVASGVPIGGGPVRKVKLAPRASIRIEQGRERRSDGMGRGDSRLPVMGAARALLFASDAGSLRATHARRGPGVMAYVGPNGGGKTLCAVQDTLPALIAGKPVWSNTPLIDPRTGFPFASYRQIEHADQLLEIDGGAEVILDEIATVANSRESQRLDPRFQIAFQQLRKRGAVVRWTAPDFARADLIFREVTQSITECRGHYTDRRSALDQWGLPDPWAPKRLFRRATYEALEFAQWSAGKRDAAKPEVVEWCYPKKMKMDPRQAYRTLQGVDKVAGILVDGNCAHCGKKVRAEYCKGHTLDEVEEMRREREAQPQLTAPAHRAADAEDVPQWTLAQLVADAEAEDRRGDAEDAAETAQWRPWDPS